MIATAVFLTRRKRKNNYNCHNEGMIFSDRAFCFVPSAADKVKNIFHKTQLSPDASGSFADNTAKPNIKQL